MKILRIYSGSTYRWKRVADGRFMLLMDTWRVRAGFRFFDVYGVVGSFYKALQWPCGEKPFAFMEVVNRQVGYDDFEEGWVILQVKKICDDKQYADFMKHFENQ